MKTKFSYILLAILGYFLIGFGYTTTLGHPISTISFVAGIILFCVCVFLLLLKLFKE